MYSRSQHSFGGVASTWYPSRVRHTGWMFSTHGIETICGYGVECGGVHGADEWVGLTSLQRVTGMYARIILSYLGQAN